jgi:hypothetical protein
MPPAPGIAALRSDLEYASSLPGLLEYASSTRSVQPVDFNNATCSSTRSFVSKEWRLTVH